MHRCSIASIASRLAGERDVNEGRDGDNTKIHLTWNNVRFYKKLIYKSRATAPSVTEPSSPGLYIDVHYNSWTYILQTAERTSVAAK